MSSSIKIIMNDEGYWLEYEDEFEGPYDVIEDAEQARDEIEVWKKLIIIVRIINSPMIKLISHYSSYCFMRSFFVNKSNFFRKIK